jgi:hypothetical protein
VRADRKDPTILNTLDVSLFRLYKCATRLRTVRLCLRHALPVMPIENLSQASAQYLLIKPTVLGA